MKKFCNAAEVLGKVCGVVGWGGVGGVVVVTVEWCGVGWRWWWVVVGGGGMGEVFNRNRLLTKVLNKS